MSLYILMLSQTCFAFFRTFEFWISWHFYFTLITFWCSSLVQTVSWNNHISAIEFSNVYIIAYVIILCVIFFSHFWFAESMNVYYVPTQCCNRSLLFEIMTHFMKVLMVRFYFNERDITNTSVIQMLKKNRVPTYNCNPLFWSCGLLYMQSQKDGCCSISDD